MDILQRNGKYSIPPGASSILGVEFSGHVAEVGSEVTSWKLNDEVFGLAAGVGFQVNVHLQNEIPIDHSSASILRVPTPSILLCSRAISSRSHPISPGLTPLAFRRIGSRVS